MLKIIKHILIKFLEIILALHGIFHVIEFTTALYEKAYITATLAFLGALSMFYATYFMQGHHHHHNHKSDEKKGDNVDYEATIKDLHF